MRVSLRCNRMAAEAAHASDKACAPTLAEAQDGVRLKRSMVARTCVRLARVIHATGDFVVPASTCGCGTTPIQTMAHNAAFPKTESATSFTEQGSMAVQSARSPQKAEGYRTAKRRRPSRHS